MKVGRTLCNYWVLSSSGLATITFAAIAAMILEGSGVLVLVLLYFCFASLTAM